jgi:hypothetical protein
MVCVQRKRRRSEIDAGSARGIDRGVAPVNYLPGRRTVG